MNQARQTIQWDDGLTGPALEIARSSDSPLRVLAGPGTGKTFSMMRRVARLLQEGVGPERILVCTFTRTAATDLKKSLAALGTEGARDVNAFTIHSFCFSLLSRADVMEITGRTPRPLDDVHFSIWVIWNRLDGPVGPVGVIRDQAVREGHN